jgi:hypothetical protein
LHTSLQVQHSTRFLTQTWDAIISKRAKVKELSKKWIWSKEDLKYTGIEALARVLQRLQQEGIYRPVLKQSEVQ